MPATRHVSKQQPLPISQESQAAFTFPSSNHLLITTASEVFAWDSTGVHTIFKSSKHGIVAVKEAKDGSGVLAVADKRVVVLHDTKHGQEKSWGLDADGDEVRHLEYTSDAKSLFLTTSLTTDIQRYSIEQSRLLSPARTHATPPVALAVSPNGHLLVSASDNPPVAYLKNLIHNSGPILIQSRTSETCVSTIAFHLERPNIFLLAFRDGALAAFDATKIDRNRAGSISNQEKVNNGELCHLPKLHRTTGSSRAPAIADAAFLPGYKTRAISVGSDGRCRLIDFADGGVILRTWHAKAPVTSVSVCSRKSESESRTRSAGSRGSHTIGGPTSTNNLIAVGRTDGMVCLYDSVGLLLDQRALSSSGEKVISVGWAKGASPRPISNTIVAENTSDLPSIERGDVELHTSPSPIRSPFEAEKRAQAKRGTTLEHIGLPSALRKPVEPNERTTVRTTRRFTVHPDEFEDGTVRHTPLREEAKAGPMKTGQYLDLFSPMKISHSKMEEEPLKRVASPPRSRPRISPQTFVKSPEAAPNAKDCNVAKPRNLALFPSTDSGSPNAQPSAKAISSRVGQLDGYKVSPFKKRKHLTFKSSSRRSSRKSGCFHEARPVPNDNAKLLTDLRTMSSIHPAHRHSSILSAFGSVGQHNTRAPNQELTLPERGQPADSVDTELDPQAASTSHDRAHGKGDRLDDTDSLGGDIWLTSDSDDQDTRRPRRKQQHSVRPPARQTSRSRVDSKGTMSTTCQQPAAPSIPSRVQMTTVDGSTDEDMHTAGTHISSNGTFSPSSNDVRELFPRSSSLSPRKGRSPRRRLQRSSRPHDYTLRELASNTVANRQVKSPWARAKASRKVENSRNPSNRHINHGDIQVFEDVVQHQADENGPPTRRHCNYCVQTRSRVRTLEVEVSQLKAQTLALKLELRKHGLRLPLMMR